MSKRDSMLFNFFEKWKEKRLSKFAKDMLKKNPELEKNLRKLDASADDVLKQLKKID